MSESVTLDPTLRTPPAQRLAESLHALSPILDSSPEVFQAESEAKILETVNTLSESTTAPQSINILSAPVSGFISPKTELVPGILTQKNIVLDDINPYTLSSKYVRSTFDRLKNKIEPERALFNAAISAAHYGQAEYFDGYDGNADRRDMVLADTVDDDTEEAVSIAEMKGAAKCMERAAIAHNILTIYGVTSTLETGRLKITKPDGTESVENHAFLRLLQPNGQEVVFDVMNPVYVQKENGDLDAKPSLYSIEPVSREPLQADLMRQSKSQGTTTEEVAAQLTFEFVDATE